MRAIPSTISAPNPAEERARTSEDEPATWADLLRPLDEDERSALAQGLLTEALERRLFRQLRGWRRLAVRGPLPAGVDRERALGMAEQARSQLAAASQRLLGALAVRLASRSIPFEELMSEANLALCAAIEAFDDRRGIRFSTYLTHAASRRLRRYVGESCRRRRRRPLCGISLDGVPDGARGVGAQRRGLCERLLHELPSEDARLLELRFGLLPGERARSFRELGEAYSVSGERMRQRVGQLLRRLERRATDWEMGVEYGPGTRTEHAHA